MSQISFDSSWFGRSLYDLREDVRLAQDEQLLAVDLDFGAAVLRIEDLVPLVDVERASLPVLDGAIADGDHLALLRLLLRGIGEDEAACGRLLLLDRLNDQPIAKGLELHPIVTSVVRCLSRFPAYGWHSTWESAKAW